MSDVNKQLLEALAQIDLAETEMRNAKAWSAGPQAKKHCDFALSAIATARQAIAAAEQAHAVAVPEGYALVPVEPMEEMLAAGQQAWLNSAGADPSFDIYRAMLAAQKGGA